MNKINKKEVIVSFYVSILLLTLLIMTGCSQSSFNKNLCTQTFSDVRDGQTYNLVLVVNQCWFAENLNYNMENSWCHGNNLSNCNTYGRLYTWESAMIACPEGWRLPSDEEWKTLEVNLGMSQEEADSIGWRNSGEVGKKLKINSWRGIDLVGFSAMPGGFKEEYFGPIGNEGIWWSSTSYQEGAWMRFLNSVDSGIQRRAINKGHGFSVRCIQDN